MVSKIGGGISWLGIWVLFRLMEFRFYAQLYKAKTRVCQAFMGGNPRTKPFLSRIEKEISIKRSRRVARTMGKGSVRN